MKNKIKKLTVSAMMAAFMCLCALMTIPTPVPFTLQTFALFLSLFVCGWKITALSLSIYICIGLLGAPVFSNFSGGAGVLISPTGGFIFGFYLMVFAFAIFKKPIISGLIGTLLCYAAGAAWYMLYTSGKSLWTVLAVCILPFILPDVLKLYLAYFISKRFKFGDLL